MALLLPPLARRERRRAPLDLARERQRGAAHLVERPAPLDAHVDVHAARARRLRPADEAEVVERRAHDAARPRGSAATRRPAPDRDRRAARRDDRDRRRAPDAGAARGRRGWPSTTSAAASRGTTSSAVRPDGKLQRDDLDPRRPRLGRALLDRRTRRRCRSGSARARSAGRPRRAARRRRPRGSSARDRAWCTRPGETAPLRGSRSRPRARRPSGSPAQPASAWVS